MPLFKCSRCECVENTAVGGYWNHAGRGEPVLCSECEPLIGKWHGRFPKEKADAEHGWMQDVNRPQFLQRIEVK